MARKEPAADLIDRVEGSVRAERMCRPGDRVLAACSGGPDSTALLDLLARLQGKLGIELGVVYIDHRQFKGSAPIRKRVQGLCRRRGLCFHGLALEGPHALPPGSNEDALRGARYALFSEVMAREGYQRLATGHSRSDQVETVLMRILRGTGVAGLAGIPAVREERYIRPLLSCSREELQTYLRARRLGWIDDPTNRKRSILRNRIRLQVLPFLQRHVQPAVDQALLRLSVAAARDQEALEQWAATLPTHPGRQQERWVALSGLHKVPDAVRLRVVLSMLRALHHPGANLEQSRMDAILTQIARAGPGESWVMDLPGGFAAGVSRERFWIRRQGIAARAPFRIRVEGPGEIDLPNGGGRLRFALQPGWDRTVASPGRVFFDGRQILFPLEVRSVQKGDRLRSWGGPGSRKVARLLLDAKIPRQERPGVPLVVKGREVLWVAGFRRADFAPVEVDCDSVLSIEYVPAESPEPVDEAPRDRRE